MNLNRFVDDHKYQIADLSWLSEGLLGRDTLRPDAAGVKKHNNVKPELEFQWGPSMMVEDAPAGTVVRNVRDEGDAGPVILFARDMMNQGRHPKSVVAALTHKFGKEAVAKHKELISKQLRLAGIVGCVAIDARGYASCKDALKTASKSPYKRFIRHTLGCSCGTPHSLPVGDSGAVSGGTGGTLDNFLAANDSYKAASRKHCRSSMLPIMAGDLDDSEMDKTLLELVDMTGMPGNVVSKIREAKVSNAAKLRMAFMWDMERQRRAGAWKPKAVKADEYNLTDPQTVVGDAVSEPQVVGEAQYDLSDPQMGDVELADAASVDIDPTLLPEAEFAGVDGMVFDSETLSPPDADVDIKPNLVV